MPPFSRFTLTVSQCAVDVLYYLCFSVYCPTRLTAARVGWQLGCHKLKNLNPVYCGNSVDSFLLFLNTAKFIVVKNGFCHSLVLLIRINPITLKP